jgi:hypothetical protein
MSKYPTGFVVDDLVSKPRYYEAFDLIGGLPSEINPNTITLCLHIWRHLNSDTNHQNHGKAWMSHPALARQIHVSEKTLQRAFDDGCDRKIVCREHLFKKNGKTKVSLEPYHPKESQGMGEYLGSRYWLDWSVIRKLQVIGLDRESSPTEPIGVDFPSRGMDSLTIGMDSPSTKGLKSGVDFSSPPLPNEPSQRSGSERCEAASERSEGRSEAGSPRSDQQQHQQQPLVVVADDFPAGAGAGDVAHASSASGHIAAPTHDVPLPNSSKSKTKTRAEENTADRIIASARLRQLERNRSDIDLFREFKAVFDRLEREYQTYNNFDEPKWFHEGDPRAVGLALTGSNPKFATNPAWAAMPPGAHFENPLQTNKQHRSDAAELYRTLGRDAVLAKWEAFLVDISERSTIERTWLLHDFVLNCGVDSKV